MSFLWGVSSEAPIAVVTDGLTAVVTGVVTTAEVTAVVTTDGWTAVAIAEDLMVLDGTEHFDGDFSTLSFLLYLHLDAIESFAALFSSFSIK